MRVLQVNKLYAPWIGGVEQAVQDLAEALKEQEEVDVEVLVCQPRGPGSRDEVNGVPVTRAGSLGLVLSMPFSLSFPWLLLRMARRCDVVHFHLPFPLATIAWLFVRWFCRAKAVVTYHSDIVRHRKWQAIYRPLLHMFLRQVDVIIVTSPQLLESSPDLKGYRRKCVVIPLFVDVEALDRGGVRRPAGFPDAAERKPLVLFVGRLAYYKGLEYLLEAMRWVDAYLVVAGDGPLRSQLLEQARRLGILDRVWFAGAVEREELLYLYRNCSCLVLPSVERSEAFGLVQIEAMSQGRPVVNTDLGTGVGFASVHGETGLTVPPRDARALAEAIGVFVRSTDLAAEYGRRARRRVEELFDSRKVVPSVVDCYRQLVRPGGVVQRGIGSAVAESGGVTNPDPRTSPYVRSFAKRAFDVVLAIVGLVASAPVWAAIALAILLDDGPPVLYSQERVGSGGAPFRMLKFRSMVRDAEAWTGPVWAKEGDSRVTRVGRFLRATALDELPQLVNIVLGHMSFVGPRPERPEFVARISEELPSYVLRHAVRPGLTGFAQLLGHYETDPAEKLAYDLEYIRTATFWGDVGLILRSFWITFTARWQERCGHLSRTVRTARVRRDREKSARNRQ